MSTITSEIRQNKAPVVSYGLSKTSMSKGKSVTSKLSARKKPSQDRSQKTVKRIRDATERLLKRSGGGRTGRITTNHIASEAEISVGSLYQYFPNAEAIIFDVYREMLGQVRAVLDNFDSMSRLSLPRPEFFTELNRSMLAVGPETDLVIAMHHAVKIYPLLADEDRKHAEYIAKCISRFLRHYGSKWSMAKLERLAIYAYYVDHGTWIYRDHVRPPKNEVQEWESSALTHLLSICFD